MVSIFGIHHDPEYYPEPYKFDPERFSKENVRSRPNYSFLPFSHGNRNCIGINYFIKYDFKKLYSRTFLRRTRAEVKLNSLEKCLWLKKHFVMRNCVSTL